MKLKRSTFQASRAGRAAWTLVEISIAMGIGSLLMLAVMQVSMFTARSFAALGNYADLDRTSRNALDIMSRDIRQAKVYGWGGNSRLWFTNLDNSWFCYAYDPATKSVSKLHWSPGLGNIRSNVLLSGCDYFQFRIFLRNPTNQFWFPWTANGQVANTKLVDLSWKCSRRVLRQFNTESVQTAKIVLRN